MDPLIYLPVVAGALVTVVGLFYRELLRRATDAEADADFWRDRALAAQGLAEIAAEELARKARTRRTR